MYSDAHQYGAKKIIFLVMCYTLINSFIKVKCKMNKSWPLLLTYHYHSLTSQQKCDSCLLLLYVGLWHDLLLFLIPHYANQEHPGNQTNCAKSRKSQKSIGKRSIRWKIVFSKIRRFEDGSGTNLGRTKHKNDPNMTPRGTQDRPQDDQKSTSKSTSNLMRNQRGHEWFWPADIGPGPPPRDPLGGAPGTQGRRPRPHGTSKKS